MANENMEPITNTVTLNISEYMGLIQCAVDFENLRKALYMGASLNYNETSLRFDDYMISTLLSIIDSERYEQKLAELKAAKQEA